MTKKILITLSVCLLVGFIAQKFSSDWSNSLRVNPSTATLYINGEKVVPSDRPGQFFNGSNYVPATFEYQGTIYVPLRLVGKVLNKPIGWDTQSYSVWLGEQPHTSSGKETSTPPIKSGADFPALNSLLTSKSSSPKSMTAAISSESTYPALFGISLGDSQDQVETVLGSPVRREPGALGYEWWIYNQHPERYVQVGLYAGKVVDLYSNAPKAAIGKIGIGTSYQSLERQYTFPSKLTFHYQGADVEIVNQLAERPITIIDGKPVIFYLDKHNSNKITAIRIIDKLPLIQGGYYETRWSYEGESPKFNPPPVSNQQRELIDSAHERQAFDLVNVIRYRYKLPQLTWHEDAAKVAKNHSVDMETADFFDHNSPTTGFNPFERLKQAKIAYQVAGENIAAGFPDAIEAHESWLNSLGHRKNILEKEFTQLGVGVRADYFTQNFITPPKQLENN